MAGRQGKSYPPFVRGEALRIKQEDSHLSAADITFRLEAQFPSIPMPDKSTVNRWLSNPASMAHRDDPELGPHGRELVAYAKRLRDRADAPWWRELGPPPRTDEPRLWSGRPAHQDDLHASVLPSAEEHAVEDEWPNGRHDASARPPFALFVEHAGAGHRSLGELRAAKGQWPVLLRAARRTWALTEDTAQAAGFGPRRDVPEGSAWALFPFVADRLDRERHRGRQLADEERTALFPIEYVGNHGWDLRFHGCVLATADNREELIPAMREAASVLNGLMQAEEFDELVRERQELDRRIKDFVTAMGSDGLLRRLAIEGHCLECPAIRSQG